jgi:XTP/dITP diphosphohydrolase
MPKILIATNNRGKQAELRALLRDLDAELVTPADLGLDLDVVEDGSTYRENAAKKAVTFAQASGLLSLADDTGLEVAALDDAPGLYSKRFAPMPNPTDADRRAYLLTQLRPHPRPWKARFRCVVAIAAPDNSVQFAEGICPGEIIPEERGEHGFGYDPIFWMPEIRKTRAELSMAEKNQISHRARAIRAALPILKKVLSSNR